MNRYYLAYGSNLNLDRMVYRCPDVRVIGSGELQDYELLFKGSKTGAYLTIEKKAGSIVPVGVFQVSERDERNLDRYEGFPTFYYKKDVDLVFPDGRKIKGFIYIMHEDRKLGVPSPDYVEVCRLGYRDFDFDQKYLDQAIKRSNPLGGPSWKIIEPRRK